jgi:hypothetical protein
VAFGKWLDQQLTASTQEQERGRVLGAYSVVSVRAVAWWRTLYFRRKQWRDVVGGHSTNVDPVRAFEENMCASVVGSADAVGYARELFAAQTDRDHTVARVEAEYEWACRVLGEYAGVAWETVQSCGGSQDAVLLMLANRTEVRRARS